MSESARRIAELQRELANHPGSRQFYQLGELLRRDGRSREAAEALRSGLAHHPRYVAAWVALGRACVDSGQAADAIQGLEQALALDRQNPVAWRLLGEAYLASGDRHAALDAWRQCIELVPGDDVLQAAVDGLSADLASAPPAEAAAADAPAAEPLGATQEVSASPVPAPDAAAAAPAPFEAELASAPEPPAVGTRTSGSAVAEAPPIAPAPAAPAPEVEAAARWAVPEPSVAGDTAKVLVQPFTEAEAEAPPAAPEVVGTGAGEAEVAEGLASAVPVAAPAPVTSVRDAGRGGADEVFVQLEAEAPSAAPPPAAPAPAAPELPMPPPVAPATGGQAGHEEELFTAPDGEQAPTVLKAVLEAPSAPISKKVPSPPPATLALARLYVQNQALPEATRVLDRLLEREPGNVEARDLLSLVRDMMEPLPEAPPPLSRRERKIAALQHWLACLTLGKERATR